MPQTKAKEVVVREAPRADSDAKKEFRQLMETYKEQSPEKYELKREELEAKLELL